MRKKLPDAWEDDWETAADKVDDERPPPAPAQQTAPLSKAERLAKHQETNRKIWESAEAPPEDFPFLAVNNNHAPPPAAASFRPAVKVLSRKPTPQMIARKDPATGLEQLTLQDDDVEEEVKEQESLEERKARQQKELEEKQRRYEEARAKIFGETKSNPPSGQSTPGNVTPPLSVEGGRGNYRGRGRGRGGPRGGNHNRNESQEKRPSTQTNPRELFDPGYSQKPGFSLQKRTETGSPQPGRSTTPRHEEQVIRAPRGPDGSGRGGFGFAKRGSPDG